jgi:predicted nucleotidyltransferase
MNYGLGCDLKNHGFGSQVRGLIMDFFDEYKEELLDFCESHGIDRLSIFGSVARGDETQDSDVDFLVRFSTPVSLVELTHLERELSALIDREVDLVTEDALHEYIKPRIEDEMSIIYDSAA